MVLHRAIHRGMFLLFLALYYLFGRFGFQVQLEVLPGVFASASGTFDLENFTTSPNQAVLVSGTVSSVPEPGTMVPLAVFLAPWLLRRNRRR